MSRVISRWWSQITRRTGSLATRDNKAQIPSFANTIHNTELIIAYATNAGIPLDNNDVTFLASAIEAFKKIDESQPNSLQIFDHAAFLSVYRRVARELPIDPATLAPFFSQFDRTSKLYFHWGLGFALAVVVVSLVTFVASTISDSIKTEIDSANSKIITLTAALLVSPNVQSLRQHDLLDLQQFAMSARSISDQTPQLRHLVLLKFPPKIISMRADSKALELDANKLHTVEGATSEFIRVLENY
jgi:hypothetical protein